MRALFQNLRSGVVQTPHIPAPAVSSGQIVVAATRSLVSPGTERMLAEFGKSNLLQKARSQPDKVRQVIDKVKTDGILPTARAVMTKLDQPLPLGYSLVGRVIAVGSDVSGFSVGDRVVCNGNHAEVVSVPENLAAKLPDSVSDEAASFTVLGAIALQGVRLLQPQVGERYVVIGLGVIGLLAVQILKASGCSVLALDPNRSRLALAERYGATTCCNDGSVDPIVTANEWSSGQGVDGVAICAATSSNAPIELAPKICRPRGKVVLVGVVGLSLNRSDFFKKEITFQVSCSYGPGRYDPRYEQQGLDYPIGYVRWTEKRNFEAIVELLRSGKISTQELITGKIPFSQAEDRYSAALDDPAQLGIIFEYPPLAASDTQNRTIALTTTETRATSAAVASKDGVCVVGAGNFTASTLLPALRQTRARRVSICSPSGATAAFQGRKFSFAKATSDVTSAITDPDVQTVIIASRHNSHARLATLALQNGKNVFVEKPLALSLDELDEVGAARSASPSALVVVGFNRRAAPHTMIARSLLAGRTEPLSITMTINAGRLPADSWILDRAVGGGRIHSEVCHFIDLAATLVNSPVVGVGALPLGSTGSPEQSYAITLSLKDGSIATINYLANGHRAIPKERIEIFSEGRVIQIDNWRTLRSEGFRNRTNSRLWSQDKGHRAYLSTFMSAVIDGTTPPQSWSEVENVTRATILADRLAHEGGGFASC